MRAGLSGGIVRIPDVERLGFGDVTDRIPDVEQLGFLCDSSDSVVEGPGFCGRSTFRGGGRTDAEVERPSEAEPLDCIGRSTADVRGATYKTLIIKDLLDFRVVIFITLKSVKALSIRQLRDAPGVYGNKKPL